ncbi:hypothetical protein [Streptomyces sp. NBC_01236]|uniref:hypothetical protein n=1 Tax=Streptomyces sp. NBC_01236 TaxID=2903789 RepID=UPI002E14B5CF|nr:hypothetical protein OG324_31260 [Streptomyces sp. NBC_01236]
MAEPLSQDATTTLKVLLTGSDPVTNALRAGGYLSLLEIYSATTGPITTWPSPTSPSTAPGGSPLPPPKR